MDVVRDTGCVACFVFLVCGLSLFVLSVYMAFVRCQCIGLVEVFVCVSVCLCVNGLVLVWILVRVLVVSVRALEVVMCVCVLSVFVDVVVAWRSVAWCGVVLVCLR